MPYAYGQDFAYTGARQTLVVPWNIDGDMYVAMSGAAGGSFVNWLGGDAGYVEGTFPVTPGETLNIYVGGGGIGSSTTSSGSASVGGYNGGGDGWNNTGYNSASGGGASDIRQGGTSASFRIVVAGGGGGASNGATSTPTGHNGGAGGALTGQSAFAPAGETGAQGGTQTAGGAGGTGVINGGNGSLSFGGDGAHASNTTNWHNGGGGGGGYYGGGGGGSTTSLDGAEPGAGGSSYVGGLSTVIANIRAEGATAPSSTGQVSHGYISLAWNLRPDVLSSSAMAVTAGLTDGGKEVITPTGLTISAHASATVGQLVSHPFSNTMAAHATLAPVKGPSSIFGALNIQTSGTMIDQGVRTTSQVNPMAAQAGLILQQTLGILQMNSFATLGQAGLTSGIEAAAMAAHTALTSAGGLTKFGSLALSSTALMAVTRLITHPSTVTMAAHGAVVDSAALSVRGGVLMVGRGVLTLSGHPTVIGSLPIMIASAALIIPLPVHHPEALHLASHASLSITPRVLVFVGPSLRALARMDITKTSLSNVSHFAALAKLAIALDEGKVLDPPYLNITDAHNSVSFFVDSEPNKGSVRQQVITHV